MPTEVKQRKKTQKQGDEAPTASSPNGKDEALDAKTATGKGYVGPKECCWDMRMILCFLSLAVCGALSWVVLQQNGRFSEMEEKYKFLHGKAASLFDMEEKVLKVSQKLAVSEDDLQEAQSTIALTKILHQDISTLQAAITSMQDDYNSASQNLQVVNAHFLNVTDTWQNRLNLITSDLAALKAESREAHTGATGRVNEAERRARSLAEKLEELEDSTRRNARAMERTEEDDAKRVQGQLDWNTKQIQNLEEHTRSLSKREGELSTQLQEYIPKAQQCEEQLPQVEEALRSIVKLGADVSAAEKRLEEVTLQVFGTEDSMLKAITEILELRQEVDTLHARNSVLKIKDELSVMKKAVRELTMVLREGRADNQKDSAPPDEEVWRDYEAEVEEEWEADDADGTAESLSDDITN